MSQVYFGLTVKSISYLLEIGITFDAILKSIYIFAKWQLYLETFVEMMLITWEILFILIPSIPHQSNGKHLFGNSL